MPQKMTLIVINASFLNEYLEVLLNIKQQYTVLKYL